MNQYIIYNIVHHTLICRQCGEAIPQDWIMLHFRRFHKTIPLAIRQDITNYGLSLELWQPNHYSKWKRLVVYKFLCGKLWVRFPTKIKTTKHITHKNWTTTKDIYGIPDGKSLL